MEVSTHPGRERRKNPRTTLTKILYVNLESGNGGIVLNVSDDGLAFHSVAPLVHSGPVRLWFSLSNDHRFEVSGELVWSNQTKKTGGLRFTNLTDSDRAQIRSLAGEVPTLSAKPAAHPTPLNARQDLASLEEGAVIVPTAPTPRVLAVNIHEPVIHAPASTFSHSILHADEPPQRLQPLPGPTKEDELPTSDAFKNGYGQYGYGRVKNSWAAPPPLESAAPSLGKVFFMLIGALVIVAAGVVLYSHSGEVGGRLVRLGERLQGTARGVSQASAQAPQQAAAPQVASPSAEQAAPQTAEERAVAPQSAIAAATSAGNDAPASSGAAENSRAADSPANISSEKAPAKRGMEGEAARHASRVSRHATPPVPAEKTPSARQASAQVEDSDSAADLDIAERYLNGIGRSRNSAAAAQFLWAAVAKGNATAELTLAHLYLNGDGVGKSCEQARLLLRAAASKGDLEANETLANLNGDRCR